MQDPFFDQLQICADRDGIANCLLSKSLAFAGAPKGNVQLLDRKTGHLTIAAQRGFAEEFLEFFRFVDASDDSVCATALRAQEITTVADVHQEAGLSRCLPIFERADVRAIQSIPLVSKSGELVGMISTHFPESVALGAAELLTMARFATLAADRLVELEGEVGQHKHRPSQENRAAWLKMGFGPRTEG